MAGNTFGKNFRITTWGESHGPAIGVIIDGCPAGLALSEADIQPMMDRRRSPANKSATGASDNSGTCSDGNINFSAASHGVSTSDKSIARHDDNINISDMAHEASTSDKSIARHNDDTNISAAAHEASAYDNSITRREADRVHILSGVFEGRTTGTPISIIIENADVRSEDYNELKDIYRPGHADFTYDAKYGFRDWRGGGRASGRETAARTAAGAVAEKILKMCGVNFSAIVTFPAGNFCSDLSGDVSPQLICKEAGVSSDGRNVYDKLNENIGSTACMESGLASDGRNVYDKLNKNTGSTSCSEAGLASDASACLINIEGNHNQAACPCGDSIGGIVECHISGVPAGLGEPVFDKLDAALAGAIMSIGGVKAVEIGNGAHAAKLKGSENNDSFAVAGDINIAETVGGIAQQTNNAGEACDTPSATATAGKIFKRTNNAGGILGGISDGDEIIVRAYFKPVPSISLPQQTVNSKGENITIAIKGRHDTCLAYKGAVVVEAMCALVLTDALFENMHARMDLVADFYKPL